MVVRVAITIGFFVIAFFFSAMMNLLIHTLFPPTLATYINDAASAVQILLILYATGFMDIVRKK